MGLTGAYGKNLFLILAGQLFGLLVGFGVALLKKTLTDGP
jgi:LPS O-antigen subunit length determinant protein (WzzB/FepE family)